MCATFIAVTESIVESSIIQELEQLFITHAIIIHIHEVYIRVDSFENENNCLWQTFIVSFEWSLLPLHLLLLFFYPLLLLLAV